MLNNNISKQIGQDSVSAMDSTSEATSNGLGSLVITAGGASFSMTCMMARGVIISVMMVCGELCHLVL